MTMSSMRRTERSRMRMGLRWRARGLLVDRCTQLPSNGAVQFHGVSVNHDSSKYAPSWVNEFTEGLPSGCPPLDDDELVLRARRGESDAFAALDSRHWG